MIQNLISGILFLTILFRAYNFSYSSTLSSEHQFFLISDFLVEILKANKTSEKITHFAIQFRSKNLTHFMNIDSLDIESNMLS